MSIQTLLAFLVGRRDAILKIAGTPNALGLGVLFVLSAGFAREYDAKDLTREPWYVLVPLGASLVTSFLLYSLCYSVAQARSIERRPFWPSYRPFLTLYWMTAPLAWLYALPVDRWLSAPETTRANLALLGLVSVWRVLLMTRVVAVVFGAGTIVAFWTVMLFADTLVLVVLFLTPLPIFNIMGGIPLSESESLIQAAALWVGFFGVTTWLMWLVGVALIARRGKDWVPSELANQPVGRVQPPLWCLAVAMILGWALVLPFTQPEQRLRHKVEQLLAEGRVAEAVDTMSRHRREDFPPHWEPPPWLGYADPRPELIDILEVVCQRDAAPWVRSVYVAKLESRMEWGYGSISDDWHRIQGEEKDRYLRIFELLSVWSDGGPSLIHEHPGAFEKMWSGEDDPGRKQRLRALLNAAGHDVEDTDATSANGAESTEAPACRPARLQYRRVKIGRPYFNRNGRAHV